MKSRLLWVFVAVIVLSTVALLLALRKTAPHPEVAIQDGKTIDFSSGKPVVKDSAKEKAAIDKAVKEMEEAAKGVTFTSPTAPPAAPKKSDAKK
jgi:maltose-binding protein MalE